MKEVDSPKRTILHLGETCEGWGEHTATDMRGIREEDAYGAVLCLIEGFLPLAHRAHTQHARVHERRTCVVLDLPYKGDGVGRSL